VVHEHAYFPVHLVSLKKWGSQQTEEVAFVVCCVFFALPRMKPSLGLPWQSIAEAPSSRVLDG